MTTLARIGAHLGCAISSFTALVGVGVAQQTLVVGSGQAFTAIPAAIAAAVPGDTVLVLAGTYPQPLNIDKGIRLVGRGAALTGGSGLFTPWITVRDIPVGQTFVMSGFSVAMFDSGNNIKIQNCAGTVAFRRMSGGYPWSIGAIDSAQVHVSSSFLYGLGSTNSTVVAESCVMDPSFAYAMTATNSSVTLVRCVLDAGPPPWSTACARLTDSTLIATDFTTIAASGGTVPAIEAVGNCTIVLDPTVTLSPTGGAPAITGATASVQDVASVIASTTGSVADLRGQGPAGALFVMALGFPGPRVPTVLGESWMDVPSIVPFYIDTYDAIDRRHTMIVPHPDLPAGLTFVVQPVHFPNDVPTLGLPSFLVAP